MLHHFITVSDPPQTGRVVVPVNLDEHRLWAQLLGVFRDMSGAFDPFANDVTSPQVRSLGRLARHRRPQHADDYFVLGDLCAGLVIQRETLSSAYAAKTIAAYRRAAEIDPREELFARDMLCKFAFWAADTARVFGTEETINIGLLICERIRQLGVVTDLAQARQLRTLESYLQTWQHRLVDEQHGWTARSISTAHESRLLCERGQMLLRQNLAGEALSCFEQSLQLERSNSEVWRWRAMALADLGLFDQALASYDQALKLKTDGASVWNSKGALLMELGRLEAALDCFQKALDISAATGAAKSVYCLNRGKVLYKLGCYHDALEALTLAYQLEPTNESAAGIAACREQLDAL